MNINPTIRIKLDLDEFTNLNNSSDMNVRIDISKYNIDLIYNVYSKVHFFEKKIKFMYNHINKELTLPFLRSNVSKFITIDFTSVVEQRNIKLNQLGIK